MKTIPILLTVFVLAISGCASNIMKSYIGKDVREAVIDYGPPSNAFDMGDGRRVFQWTKNVSFFTPMTARTNSTITGSGPVSWVNSNTTITGGQTFNSKCLYTVFGKWDKKRKGWIVHSFRKPNLMCE